MTANHNQGQDMILTGYLKRKPLESRLEDLIQHVKANKQGAVSAAYLDIDNFSQIESRWDYEIADALLTEIAAALEALKTERPDIAVAGWYTRDSYLVVYNLGLDEAHKATEELRQALSNSAYTVGPQGKQADLTVTFSAGVSAYDDGAEDPVELLDLAEDAARRAYQSGGNATYYGRPMKMRPKTNLYLPTQLDRLTDLSGIVGRTEASLLREALSDLLRKFDQRDSRRKLQTGPPDGTGAAE